MLQEVVVGQERHKPLAAIGLDGRFLAPRPVSPDGERRAPWSCSDFVDTPTQRELL